VSRVYSALLADVIGVNSSDVELFTVPAGHLYVVRHITASFDLVDDATIVPLRIKLDGGTPVWWMGVQAVVSNRTYDWAGRHAVPSGRSLLADGTGAAGWDVLVSGYDLTTP
jgi:hypothetical protein